MVLTTHINGEQTPESQGNATHATFLCRIPQRDDGLTIGCIPGSPQRYHPAKNEAGQHTERG